MEKLLLLLLLLGLVGAGVRAHTLPVECGMKRRGALGMTGGGVAEKHEFPWQVTLQLRDETNKSEHFCGGAVMSEQWVLTARRCFDVQRFYNMSINPFRSVFVVAGEHDLNQTEGDEQSRRVAESVQLSQHNLVLLKLARPLLLDTMVVAPICLPGPSQGTPGFAGDCFLSGWGDASGVPSHVPKKLRMPILHDNECINFGVPFGDSVCAGCVFGKEGAACWGDIGSPLTCRENDDRFYVRGVLTRLTSMACMPPYTPAVYAKVDHVVDYIKDIIGCKE